MIENDLYRLPPEATLITGPVGSGKTEAVLEGIAETQGFRAFATIWVLLATDQQIHAFRERLLARSADAVLFGVEFFNFYSLYRRLLDLAGDPQQWIEDTSRYQVLRHLIATLRNWQELEYFGPIAHLPGFIGLVAGLIDELKQGLVLPDQFHEAAARRGPKDRDLDRIYTAYQHFLKEKRLVDRHGAGWLAVQHVRDDPRLVKHVDLLVVDGFDQFNRVHVELLTALAQGISRTILTLTHPPGEQERSFRRFGQTRDRLIQSGDKLWRVQPVSGSAAPRHIELDHLVQMIFRTRTRSVSGSGAVALIEAPDRLREVQAVLRRVKQLLLDGASPESIAIAARRITPYSGALREMAQGYGIPLVVRENMPLRQNPAVADLLALIDLHRLDFPRREVMDALRSPYFAPPDLTPDQIARLERISLDYQVVRGREPWLEAIEEASIPRRDEDGELVTALDPAEAEQLAGSLDRDFARITPPPKGTASDWVGWIEALIGPDPAADAEDSAELSEESESTVPEGDHLNVVGCIRAAADAGRVARDILAVSELKKVLSGIRAAHDLVAEAGDRLAWADFRAELEMVINNTQITPPGGLSRLGRVLATDVLEMRGLPHDHLFLLGLSEGLFPEHLPEEVLYAERERQSLEADGIDLQTLVERADDASLFYQAIGQARQSLTISRFYVDDQGAPCPPSPYWNAVRAAVELDDSQVERVKVGAAPGLHEAAALNEAAVAVAAILSSERSQSGVFAAHNMLLEHPEWGDRWRNVLRGRAIEARREDSRSPFDHTSGVLTQPDLVAITAQALGPDHIWSASQLNDYGLCPFRFFARRLLRLEELQEPAEGLDMLQRGLLNHAILEHTYRQIGQEKWAISPENRDRALAILDDVAQSNFESAPRRFGFRPSPIWDHECAEMLRQLRWLVQLDFSEANPFRLSAGQRADKHPLAALIQDAERRPFWLEAEFGMQGDFALDGPAGPVRVRGVIDRMDRAGDRVAVIDYKTGATKHPVEDMRAGRDFQMVLYLLAAQEQVRQESPGLQVAGGLFWHIANRTVSGEVLASDETLAEALAHLHEFILAARVGWFVVQPRQWVQGQCAGYCEFRTLCRMTRGYLHKPG